ncbi:uncharacterized protein LOC116159965 [Photinus pyralis]|nr:uncharacterized protein LOC116159965 [Photinus pyralis]
METKLFGLSITELRKIAYQLAQMNQVPHNFNNNTHEAGKDWVRGFLKRHPQLSIRSPEPTSAARAMDFNRTSVQKFFECLINVYDRYKFPAGRIFNCDETGLTTVGKKSHSKIIAKRGRRQVGAISSAERGQLITAELCFSAAGNYVPPLLIFPRQRMKPELLDGAPPGTIAACHSSGWMQSEIFVQWLRHFINHTKPTENDPVLLLLDGHASHTKNLEAIKLARESHVVLLCFPPHCSHRMQPLDVGFMAPLSVYYGQAIKVWLRTNPGRVVTQFQIAKLFGTAFTKAASMETAMHAFSKPGIWPLNPNVFTDIDFAPSDVTERPTDAEISEIEQHIMNDRQTPPPQQPADTENNTSLHGNLASSEDAALPGCSNSFTVGPEVVCPIPKGVRNKATRQRGKAAILTSTPYKDDLEEQINNSRTKQVKRKLVPSGPSKITKQKKNVTSTDDSSSEDDDNPDCAKCKRSYSKSKANEGWVECRQCHKWYHEACTGVGDEDLDTFICNKCI